MQLGMLGAQVSVRQRRHAGDSSKAASSNPIVKVCTGRSLCACINATMAELSTPPDRNAPRGTSEIICLCAALPSTSPSAATASPSSSTLVLCACLNVCVQVPIPADANAAMMPARADRLLRWCGRRRSIDREDGPGFQFVEARMNAARCGHIHKAQILRQCVAAHITRAIRMRPQCLKFRPEHQRLPGPSPVERLFPHPDPAPERAAFLSGPKVPA